MVSILHVSALGCGQELSASQSTEVKGHRGWHSWLPSLSPQMSVQTSWLCASETSPSTAICSPLEVGPGGSLPGEGLLWLQVGQTPRTGGTGSGVLPPPVGQLQTVEGAEVWPRVPAQVRRGSVNRPLCPRLSFSLPRPPRPLPGRPPQLLALTPRPSR